MPEKTAKNTVAQNKKAYHDYFVDETFEAVIAKMTNSVTPSPLRT